jgi:hypothetical protein
MTKRILLAGVLGGFALFVWGGLAHTVLGLGLVGVQYLPQQQAVMGTLQTSVPQSGLYFFPQTDAAGKVPAEKAGGPYGMMIYHPTGAGGSMTGQLVDELILNIVMACFAAFLLSLATGLISYGSRVGFVTLLGLAVGLMTNMEYWNWYGFPLNYTIADTAIVFVGFVFIALIAAALVKPSAQRMMAVPAKAA